MYYYTCFVRAFLSATASAAAAAARVAFVRRPQSPVQIFGFNLRRSCPAHDRARTHTHIPRDATVRTALQKHKQGRAKDLARVCSNSTSVYNIYIYTHIRIETAE